MARCEQGYLCDVCGQEVEAMADSDLYLRYILGEVPPDRLMTTPERHIRCNPTTAQFIVAPGFTPVFCEGMFAKEQLDPAFVREQEERVTRAWQRLQDLPRLGLTIEEYPLPEARPGWGGG
ncbi:MAG: hypothetical protein JNM56_04805 [Planctomycetia bacterium]|nr:hypothetical protein [Planctomycetia bacterium]